jgi:hypothetical protein
VQAFASITPIAAVVLSPPVEAFETKLGNADTLPSVILTEVEHKKITADLRTMTSEIEIKHVKKPWSAYKKVLKEHPA